MPWVGVATASVIPDDGRHTDAPLTETVVFVQRHGQWRVLHAHRSAPDQP